MDMIFGIILGLFIGFLAKFIKFDNDKSFYPIILMVIATYYILFSLQAADIKSVFIESLFAAIFILSAIIAFKYSLWIVVIMLLSHGIYDFIIPHSGAPNWWRGFCLAVDFVLAAFLALKLLGEKAKKQ